MAAILKAFPGIQIKIGGYTDNTGSQEMNMKLSQARAEAVAKAVAALGVDAARLDAEGYGPQHPVASNDTEEGRSQNRRIDVRVKARS
jgi:outer membrane protein OmpA-like peptidoglycan-associated protein